MSVAAFFPSGTCDSGGWELRRSISSMNIDFPKRDGAREISINELGNIFNVQYLLIIM